MRVTNNIFQKIALGYLLVLVIFWSYLGLTHSTGGTKNYIYSFLFGLMPLVGGIVGIIKSKIWGRFGSAIGKAVFFFSLGLLLWGLGESIWSYYNGMFNWIPYFHIEVVAAPYPSLADIGFAPSIFFWGVGAVFLSKASGARFAFKNSKFAKAFTFIVPVLLTLLAYFLLVKVARHGVIVPEGENLLKVILDIAYPLGDFIALILSVVIFGLSFKYFGGYFRLSIISILLGLGVMFAGDFIFSYTTTIQTFYNGDWGDLVLTMGLFFITFGILGFATTPPAKLKSSEENTTDTSTLPSSPAEAING